MKANLPTPERIAEFRTLAIEIFGTKTMAYTWLDLENFALGATPKSLANSEAGFLEVQRVLGTIKYGGVAYF
jgi:uncharacterized protein (DUF2384 family)